jgi:hypothetical protein
MQIYNIKLYNSNDLFQLQSKLDPHGQNSVLLPRYTYKIQKLTIRKKLMFDINFINRGQRKRNCNIGNCGSKDGVVLQNPCNCDFDQNKYSYVIWSKSKSDPFIKIALSNLLTVSPDMKIYGGIYFFPNQLIITPQKYHNLKLFL